MSTKARVHFPDGTRAYAGADGYQKETADDLKAFAVSGRELTAREFVEFAEEIELERFPNTFAGKAGWEYRPKWAVDTRPVNDEWYADYELALTSDLRVFAGREL